MEDEPQLAFRNRDFEPPGLEIVVNFGVFAGREATPAEIDELAAALLPEVADVSIVSELRHEIGEDVEAALHQVRVQVAGEHLPTAEGDVERLSERLVDAAEQWAEACIAERHAEVTEL
jgi:hypothetical protein